MKWFKHISNSLDDPFIFDLLNTHGADGYLVFFGVLEIYSREFKTELGWKLSVTRSYLRQKLCKRQDTLIVKCLEHIKNSGKWEVIFNGEQVTIFIPKFHNMVDEFTKKKIGTKSGHTPEKIQQETETEVEVDLKEAKAAAPSNHFSASVGEQAQELIAVCRSISSTEFGKKFNPFQYVQKNKHRHPKALIITLQNVSRNGPMIKSPWPYADKVLLAEDCKAKEFDNMSLAKSREASEAEYKAIYKQFFENFGRGKSP